MGELKKKLVKCVGGNYGLVYKVYCYLFHKRRYLWNEHLYNRHGKKSREKYVVIRMPFENTGLMAHIGYYMCLISYYTAKNYVPVIDMKNYKSPYISEEEVGKTDVWSFWFKPVGEVDIDSVYKNKKIMLSGHYYKGIKKEQESLKGIANYDSETVKKWSAIYKKYFHLNEEMQEKIRKEQQKLFGKRNGKILGVKFRTTDYIYNLKENHSIQATSEEMLGIAEKIMQKDGFDRVYLAVENPDVVKEFQKKLGKSLLVYHCKLANYFAGEIIDMSETAAQMVGRRQSGEDYLIQILLLSACDGLLCCQNSGINVAIAMNGGKYEKVYYVNKGVNETGKTVQML